MIVKNIRDVKKLAGKRVLLRTDFNVPYSRGVVKDDYKIQAELPTIRYLLNHKCRIIIITHFGRPNGKNDKKFSLKPIAGRLSRLLKKRVVFVNDIAGFKAGNAVNKLKDGQVAMLENLRFASGEAKNSIKFVKILSSFSDIYINDAFSVCHRNHASVSAIKNYLPAYAGLMLEQEIISLDKALNPKRPLVVVIGGAKVDTKIPMIQKFYGKAQRILIGGAVANNFLAARNFPTGKSLLSKQGIRQVKKLTGSKILLPMDVVVGTGKDNLKVRLRKVKDIEAGDCIYDIGPATIRLYAKYIKQAGTIIWNGPMGFFEVRDFRSGTLSIARLIAARSKGRAFGIVGGGETIEALNMTKMGEYVDWISTGGGAMLAYLGGESMPGLEGLVK